jgi:hypothetical protein
MMLAVKQATTNGEGAMKVSIYRNTNKKPNRINLGYVKVSGMRLLWFGPLFILIKKGGK